MKKYILTSPRFIGSVTFGYDSEDNLIFYHAETDSVEAVKWLKFHLPSDAAALEVLKTKIKGEITEVPQDTSFDAFWDAYAQKVNAKRCRALYAKMSESERLKSIINIKSYEKYLAITGYRGKADPEKYLKNEYYGTDWNKAK